MKKALVISLIISVAELLTAVILYQDLPELIPLHWNIAGVVDRYGNKATIFILPAISIIVTLWLYYLPHVVPKGDNIKKSGNAYPIIIVMTNFVLAIVFAVIIATSFGYMAHMDKVILVSVGILIMCIGNYLPKIRPNYSFGIRLPWTLADESVWVKTHRLGGKIFFAMGVLFIVGIFLPIPANFIIPITGTFAGLVVITIYAYAEYKRTLTRV